MSSPLTSWLFKSDPDSVSYVDLMQFARYADFERGIIECKDGELMVAWNYTGIDHESSSPTDLNWLSYRLNELMKTLGRGWSSWTEALRLETNTYPRREDCHFPDEVSQMIDEERRIAVHEQEAHFETVAFVVLMYKPPSKASQRIYDAIIDSSAETNKESLEEKQLKYFIKAASQFQGGLSSFFPVTQLVPYKDELGHEYCDFARLLHYCATGIMRPVRIPDRNIELDCLICGQDFDPSFNPQVGDQHISIVSVEGIQAHTTPAMLAVFDSRPMRYRWSTRFIYMDRVEAVESLTKYHRKWSQQVRSTKDQLTENPNPRINLDAANMVADAALAQAEVSSGDVNQGLYTSVFVIYSDTLEEAEESAEYFKNFLNAHGFGGRIERMNATEAFLGSIPGNTGANVAKTQISTANLADLLPVASTWPGEEFCSCNKYPKYSPPLIQCETPNSTPFRLNLHVNDLGHTLVIGVTRSGKSTLLAIMAAQFRKYKNAKVVSFDVGMSMFAICQGVGGNHYEIGSDGEENNRTVTLMPLQFIDTPSELARTVNWVETCIELQGLNITPGRHRAIEKALKLLRDSNSRTITEFISNLQDKDLREAMAYYSIDGTAGHILDGDRDTAELDNFTVFEVQELLALGEKILIPTLEYLFERIERSLDGSPTLLILDECWMMFDHPTFREKLRAWLKKLAKLNVAIVMATQSIVDAMKSGIVETIIDSTATKILLPHPDVESDINRPFYLNTLGLNRTEMKLLATGIPQKQYYYSSANGKRMFELNLRPKTLSYVARGSREDIAMMKTLISEYPENWREKWLDHCLEGS
ncbi:hypothetical protein [Maritalea sp.]|uniref:TraG/VirB4 family ATPase n=1 Tax=Maritalea sp. TaxID=2003361 RepID=UPI003EF6019D